MARNFLLVLLLAWLTTATSIIQSNALLTCMDDSQVKASKFDIVYNADENKVYFSVSAVSTLNGSIAADVYVFAYGIQVVHEKVSSESLNIKQLAEINPGHFTLNSSSDVPQSVKKKLPGIAFTIPDLDAKVKIVVYSQSDLKTPAACVEASLSNGKTVQTKYASWSLAAAIFVGLTGAGLFSVSGHLSTAAHIAANTLSLFTYFQNLAVFGFLGVQKMPPIGAAWCQNFVWTLGIIKVSFLQKIINWYVQSTGGDATNILANKNLLSIEVQKRDLSGIIPDHLHAVSQGVRYLGNLVTESDIASGHAQNLYRFMNSRMVTMPMYHALTLLPRADSGNVTSNSTDSTAVSGSTTTNQRSPTLYSQILVLRGIQRVAYLADIELTSFFVTGIVLFIFAAVLALLMFLTFKSIVELLVLMSAINPARFRDFRQHWPIVFKGLLHRLLLVGFIPLTILCLWQFLRRDSPGTVVLATFAYISTLVVLGISTWRVIILGQRSLRLYKNPAYILYSDPTVLNKLGFLYVQYKASAYYFLVPFLIYCFLKGSIVAFGQNAGKVQAICICILELVYLVVLCLFRPYMDRKMNVFNIAISAVTFINSIFFIFFSQLFGQPIAVSSITAVVFFILNATFAFILLVSIVGSCLWAAIRKNPDARYQQMADDRVMFTADPDNGEKAKVTELDALGVTARGNLSDSDPHLPAFDRKPPTEPGRYMPFKEDSSSMDSTNNNSSVSLRRGQAGPLPATSDFPPQRPRAAPSSPFPNTPPMQQYNSPFPGTPPTQPYRGGPSGPMPGTPPTQSYRGRQDPFDPTAQWNQYNRPRF